jgi:hypothetical protein
MNKLSCHQVNRTKRTSSNQTLKTEKGSNQPNPTQEEKQWISPYPLREVMAALQQRRRGRTLHFYHSSKKEGGRNHRQAYHRKGTAPFKTPHSIREGGPKSVNPPTAE